MKKIQIMAIAVIMGLAIQSQASLYNITFNGGGLSASGQIDVSGGVAISGYLDVTSGGNQGIYNLVGLTSTLINGYGDTVVFTNPSLDLIFDDQVNPNNDPFLTGDGLLFANDHNVGFNLWGNGPGSYTLFNNWGNNGNGSATISLTPVPEASTVCAGLLLLLPFGLSTARRLRRNRTA